MKIVLALLQEAPSPEQLKQLRAALDPIIRNGRENISYLYSLDAFDWTIIVLYFGILLLLAILGIIRLRMVYQFWRYRHIKPEPLGRYTEKELPRITVQLPLFNELYVAERLIDSIIRLDYPRHLLEIQVLDDSTDETVEIASKVVEKYALQGFDINYIHRSDRTGYKAGALENGLKSAKGELLAIFDADFTPWPDCLRKMVDYFTDERIGAVQMRWSHINGSYSLFTRVQEILLDSHFVIEQTSRNRTGAFFNFNGTAGMWRREAIEWSGGWQHDTLTEDTDLSFRAQLMGWKFVYLLDQDAPAELPVEINAFKAQQRRWAKGLVQVGLKLMPRIWKHPKLSFKQKLELFFRLFGNCAAILMIILSLLHIPVLIVRFNQGLFQLFTLDIPIMLFATFSVICFYGSTIYFRYPQEKWRYWLIPLCMAMGIGLVFSNTRAVLEALFGVRTGFVRTPKYRVESTKDNWLQAAMRYRRKKGLLPLFELAFAFYFLFAVYYAFRSEIYATIPWLMLFLLGYGYMAIMSLFQGSFRKMVDSIKRG
jgi:cellulose synthase/poly-beta-1,6-N-acetylglucosamine synthase-like glycosyltransferase